VPIRVQVARDDRRILLRVDHEDPPPGLDWGQRRAAAVEQHEVGLELDGHSCALVDVRGEHGARQTGTAPAAADRLHAGERCRFQVVRRGVTP
jgi:hypothetical protein